MRAARFITGGCLGAALIACGGEETPPITTPQIAISGHIELDDQTPASGASVTLEGIHATAVSALRAAWVAQTRSGLRATTALSLESALTPATATTDAHGDFHATIDVDALPIRILASIRLATSTSTPILESARWKDATTSTLDLGTIILPSLARAAIPLSDGAGQNEDGSIRVVNLAPEVELLFGRSYDPDESRDAFPGEFAEMGLIPLNSSLFLWMEGLDAAGNPVRTLSQAATIRSRIAKAQWIDLEDIQGGTDRIEVPIYAFDPNTNLWMQEPEVGWLEDAAGTVLPEDAEGVILDGTFTGDVYATYNTGHFSWMNVDYASIGPWTLSRMDASKRNDDCFYNAVKLADAIVHSTAGRAAYQKLNKAGGDLDVELANAAGPEIKSTNLTNAYGEFKGNEQGDRDDQLYLDDDLWSGCGAGATADQKKNTTLLMADTLVHETGHWKWDVKHDDGNWTNAEPTGEAGNVVENDVFGGILGGGADGVSRDGTAVDSATRDNWLDPGNWTTPGGLRPAQGAEGSPGLAMQLSLEKTTFELGEEIPVVVKYENTSAAPIRAMKLLALEGYPLWFEIVREGETTRVPFRGTRGKRAIDWTSDFVSLSPAQTADYATTLMRDTATSGRRYNLVRSGSYQVTAVYSGLYGLLETRSNTLTFTVGAGGAIGGTVTDAATGDPMPGGTISAIQQSSVITSATSGADGTYLIPELPGGTYTLEARAPGHLRSRVENVLVTPGQTIQVSFSLSELLAAGQLRLVLSWGDEPRDLDSHLWLPAEKPYHVYYSREGAADVCPFAILDVDDTSGQGPETITITDFFDGTYVYAIKNYTGSPAITVSGARVQVFDSSGLIASYDVPATGEDVWWQVLTIDGATGAITEVNVVEPFTEPYTDTSTGCEP
ncbi:MAG: carboxypeptidase regulatory-like domain-containing protein [Deltaproteobacteria bacterium]|nr:carboxypeptidase regulatory-like domain-containing protein [Deltaproteobacteria bacterium]